MTNHAKLEAYSIAALFVLRWRYKGTLSKEFQFSVNGQPLTRPLLGVSLQDGADYLLIAPLATMPKQCKVDIIDGQGRSVSAVKRLIVNPFTTFPLTTLPLITQQRICRALLQQSTKSFATVHNDMLAAIAKMLALHHGQGFTLGNDQYCVRFDWPAVHYDKPKTASVTLWLASGERIDRAAKVVSVDGLQYCIMASPAPERRTLETLIIEAGSDLFVPLHIEQMPKASVNRLPVAALGEALTVPASGKPMPDKSPNAGLEVSPVAKPTPSAAPGSTGEPSQQFDADMRLDDDGSLCGWIKRRTPSHITVKLKIFVDDRCVGDTIANRPVQNPSARLSDVGAHGFRFKLPNRLFDGRDHVVTVVEAGQGRAAILARFNYRFAITPEWLESRAKAQTDSASRVQLTVENLIPLADNRLFLSGWLVDQDVDLQAIVLVDGGRIVHSNVLPEFVAVSRPDIYERLRAEVELANADLGFFCVVSLSGNAMLERLRNAVFYTVNRAREVMRYPINDRALDQFNSQPVLSRVKRILAVSQAVSNKAKVLDQLGPLVRDLWASRARPRLQPQTIEFGTQPAKPLVSIVVPLYGRYDFVKHQLALFADDHDMHNQELIYVNDDPRMQSAVVEMCRAWAPIFKVPFRLLSSGHNLGYSGANNFGVRHANGRYLLLLNSDVMPKSSGWLREMVTALDSLPHAGAVGPVLLYEDDSVQHAGIAFERYAEWGGMWINDHPGKGVSSNRHTGNAPAQVQAVSGACLLLRKALYDEVGGLDENYIQGDFEDSDLCLKLLEAGHPSYVIPSVRLYHLERQSIGLVDNASLRNGVTAYNCWLHSERWDSTIVKLMKSPDIGSDKPATQVA